MSEKTLKFNNVRVNKKEFHKSKQPTDLDLVTINQIVTSDKFKHSAGGFKYFIGYQKDETVKPLCIILPQISGYRKYFENSEKNMSFMIKMTMCWIYTIKFGTKLKKSQALNFIACLLMMKHT